MFYFHTSQPSINLSSGNTSVDALAGKFLDLHSALHPRVRNHNFDLHPRWQQSTIVTRQSAASVDGGEESVVLTYMRSREQAVMVERLMGREGATVESNTYRHPVIELRLTKDHFAIELIVSPQAWLDQQNLIGKLDLPQHRAAFRTLLRGLDPDYRLGFWSGTHLGDMHLTISHLMHGRILDDWMMTFCDGLDWLRVGKWYHHGDPVLDSDAIVMEAFNHIKALHTIYTFILWTSNNNFRSFYEKRVRIGKRAYA
jgi:hypothetical protein